jgi:hypothetical protein
MKFQDVTVPQYGVAQKSAQLVRLLSPVFSQVDPVNLLRLSGHQAKGS